MTTAVKALTATDQEKIIKLYESGITKYTEIAKKLKLEYTPVNKFMTKWKAQHGVLRSRAEAKAKEKASANEMVISTTDRPKQISMKEYQFLKNFYLQRKLQEDMGSNG